MLYMLCFMVRAASLEKPEGPPLPPGSLKFPSRRDSLLIWTAYDESVLEKFIQDFQSTLALPNKEGFRKKRVLPDRGGSICRILAVTTTDERQFVLGIDWFPDASPQQERFTKEVKECQQILDACPKSKKPLLTELFGKFEIELPVLQDQEYIESSPKKYSVHVMSKAKGRTISDILVMALDQKISYQNFAISMYNVGKQLGAAECCFFKQEPKVFFSAPDPNPKNFLYDPRENQLYMIDFDDGSFGSAFGRKRYVEDITGMKFDDAMTTAVINECNFIGGFLNKLLINDYKKGFGWSYDFDRKLDKTEIEQGNFESLSWAKIKLDGLHLFLKGYFEELDEVNHERMKYYFDTATKKKKLTVFHDIQTSIYVPLIKWLQKNCPNKAEEFIKSIGVNENSKKLQAYIDGDNAVLNEFIQNVLLFPAPTDLQ